MSNASVRGHGSNFQCDVRFLKESHVKYSAVLWISSRAREMLAYLGLAQSTSDKIDVVTNWKHGEVSSIFTAAVEELRFAKAAADFHGVRDHSAHVLHSHSGCHQSKPEIERRDTVRTRGRSGMFVERFQTNRRSETVYPGIT